MEKLNYKSLSSIRSESTFNVFVFLFVFLEVLVKSYQLYDGVQLRKTTSYTYMIQKK